MNEKCIFEQCSKLRVHPAPSVHILAALYIVLGTRAHGVCMFLQTFKYVYIVSNTRTNGWVHHLWSLCTRQVHKITS